MIEPARPDLEPVTSEVAGSSPVVPAIVFNYFPGYLRRVVSAYFRRRYSACYSFPGKILIWRHLFMRQSKAPGEAAENLLPSPNLIPWGIRTDIAMSISGAIYQGTDQSNPALRK